MSEVLECKATLTKSGADNGIDEYWEAQVTTSAHPSPVTVRMNVDTIICQCEGAPFKSYAWGKSSDVLTEAIACALKYNAEMDGD